MVSLVSFASSVALSVGGGWVAHHLIREYIPIFIERKMAGRDMCKTSSGPIPEPMGIIAAAVYLIVMIIFIPIPTLEWEKEGSEVPCEKFLLSALFSICLTILLGFVDDMLDLRWRHKLIFPTLSALPLLMAYYRSGMSTTVLIPDFLHEFVPAWIGRIPSSIDIHILYFVYMGMMVVFCTNAINILAGINGLEVGQALVIAVSVVIFNVVQIYRVETQVWYHQFSLYILLPFISTSYVLYIYNRYPARVFVGDTFCYWAGMTLATVCILGHFSKTMLLFLIPQVFNFLYSIPQLFHWVPCPRHRLPKFDPKTDTVGMSVSEFKASELKFLGKFALGVFKLFGLLHREDYEKDGESWIRVNNLTIINLTLKFAGPMHERSLTNTLLLIQAASSALGFFIRFYLAHLVYEHVH